jgi:hypothetical protein
MDKYTKEFAEFIGILLGDGSISIYKKINHQRIKISLDSNVDKDYSKYVSKLITSLFNEKPIIKKRKNENTLDLFLFKREIIHFLINEIGMQLSPKYKRAIIPDKFLSAELANSVLKGYFDTDGSVAITKNNGTKYPRIEMKICNSPMQDQFISILTKTKIRFGTYSLDKGAVRIQINGKKQLYKWMESVGSNNPKHIDKIKMFIN